MRVTARLVLATANPGKVRELTALLDGLGYAISSLVAHPTVRLPLEGTTSYAENARAKARATTASLTEVVAIGDDSGLEVDLLSGRPGVASAGYGGPGLHDAERVARLLAEVANVGAASGTGALGRTARFRCVLALVAPWGAEAMVEGTVEGVLAEAPRGAGGFGYDPIFVLPSLGRTMAELGPDDKAAWSHRGRAARAARPILAAWVRRVDPSR